MAITALIVPAFLTLLVPGRPPAGQTAGQPYVATARHARSVIGVMVQEIDAERAKALKLPEDAGVEITRVEPGSPAEKAGLRPGDAIVHYNGEHVEGMKQFARLVRETPAGRQVKIDIYRGGAPQTLTVTVGERQRSSTPRTLSSAVPPLGLPSTPAAELNWQSPALGIEAETIYGQLAQYFGVSGGVLVRSIAAGSPAEMAGIRAGDVIINVDHRSVGNAGELATQLAALRGKTVALVVMRDHKEITLAVTLD